MPPGYDPSTWKAGQWDNGRWFLRSPDDNIYTIHPEDENHWRHWDKQDPNGKDRGKWPPNSNKPEQNRKRKLKPDQCSNDPSGNAPEWKPPIGNIPFMPFEGIPGGLPLRIPGGLPVRIPIPAW